VDHVCWTMGGQVCIVGLQALEVRRAELRARRFVEVGPQAGRFV